MTRPNIITEKLRLADCVKGETLRIPHSETATRRNIGDVVLSGIKPLAKGRVQIKYRAVNGGTVQKVDIDGSLVVERMRDAVEADGPGAGVPVLKTVVHEDVVYQAIDPLDDPVLLLDSALASPIPGFPAVSSRFLKELTQGDYSRSMQRLMATMLPSTGRTNIRSMNPSDLNLVDVRLR